MDRREPIGRSKYRCYVTRAAFDPLSALRMDRLQYNIRHKSKEVLPVPLLLYGRARVNSRTGE